MISAVAARKAALAAQGLAQTDFEPTFIPHASSDTPSQKRKASQQRTSKPKKARKAKPLEKANGRNSKAEEDEFVVQKDVIIVESDDSVEEEMSMSDDSDGSALFEPVRSSAMDVSSDDEEALDEALQLDISTLLPHISQSQRQSELDEGALLSTFQPQQNHNVFQLSKEECSSLGFSTTTTLIGLNGDESLCLLGACTLVMLRGSIELCGTSLCASPVGYSIYAPRSAPLPILRPGQEGSSVFQDDKFSPRLLPLLQHRFILGFQELATNIEGLGQVCRSFEGVFGPTRWAKSSTATPFGISGLHMVTRSTKDFHTFETSPSWSTALDSATEREENDPPKIFIVKGPKNSGKSTFARTLVNRLLFSYERVAFLECDIGQSEFTPGGMVSLNIISSPIFGPPFTHPTLPYCAHFIGSTTPRSSPSHYLDAVSALIRTYQLDIQTPAADIDDSAITKITDSIPLVVNTMGWVKGLGADLTQKIESILEPTDIIDIQASARPEQYPGASADLGDDSHNVYRAYRSNDIGADSTARTHILDPIAFGASKSGFTAADHRNISILSYFHAIFPKNAADGILEQIVAQTWDTSRPLCAIPPYEVDSSLAFDKVILTGAGSEDVVEEEIERVLNGAIVGLVACEPGTLDIAQEGSAILEAGIPYTRQCAPPSPASSKCVGLAIVRGVSSPTQSHGSHTTGSSQSKVMLHMLTPLPPSLLAEARVLVKGEMELPVWGMLDFRTFSGDAKDIGEVAGVEAGNVPYLQWGKGPEGVIGAEKRRVRRNLMRKGQM